MAAVKRGIKSQIISVIEHISKVRFDSDSDSVVGENQPLHTLVYVMIMVYFKGNPQSP